MEIYSVIILCAWFSSLIVPFLWVGDDGTTSDSRDRNNKQPSEDTHFMKG